MRKVTKFVGLIVAGFVALAVIALGLVFAFSVFIGGGEPEADSFSHEVEYRLEFQPNGTLNDTELIVPYPEDGRFQSAVRGNVSNVSILNDMNASLSIVETSRGEMLRLEMGRFEPETREERFSSSRDPEEMENVTGDVEIVERNISGDGGYTSYDLVIKAKYNRSLDTRNGLEDEPHLRSESSTECRSPRETGCATTEAFVSYEASDSTHTELSVRLEGRNSWWNWGWSGNSYSQRFYNSFYDDDNLVGSQDRWITLTGREDQGEGNYRG
ncbi:MAG: hypothetical protein MUP63_02970 [Candidatus Nanohaloarchaeota archaeon QJJ-7]|nr:hypothetical protein [Candidatus Nanohaloarchaeota archaeon QJJ-7]